MKLYPRMILSFLGLIAGISVLLACGGSNPVPTPIPQSQKPVPQTVAPAAPATPISANEAAPTAGKAASEAVTSPSPMAARPTAVRPTPGSAPVRVPGAAAGEAVITVTGQVWDVAASARVIDFVESVHGVSAVAVDDRTEITSAEGQRVDLSEVKPGMVVQASGQTDGQGAVLAGKVRIITAPSPLPATKPPSN